jgi:hypothetical protein
LGGADAALDGLAPDLTTVVLGRLVGSTDDCHLHGVANSSRLRISANARPLGRCAWTIAPSRHLAERRFAG